MMQRRTLLLIGLCMLALATALLAVPGHIAILVTGRILQGFSASIVWTSGLALLTDTFGQGHLGEVVGYVLSSVSLGSTTGPLLGGLVYSRGGYQGVTYMSLSTIVLDVIMRLLMTSPNTETDHKESATSTTEAHHSHGQSNGAADSPYQVPDERAQLIPKISTSHNAAQHSAAYFMLLRSSRILADLWGIFIWGCVMTSFETLLPSFVSKTFSWGSSRAGLVFLSWIIPGFLAPLAGKCSDRFGPRWIVVGGYLSAIPPLILLRLITDDSVLHQVLLCALLVLVGKFS